MKAPDEQQTVSPKDFVVTENPELDQIFKGRILFPEKIEMAKEHIRKYGLPKEINASKSSNR
jgi:hypothetical protein